MSSTAEDLDEDRHYTYADFLEWDEGLRAEIIDGKVYMMTPGAPAPSESFLSANGPKGRMAPPSRMHQEISGELYGQLWTFLKGKPCKVYPAPFGVRLFPRKDMSDDTVVEPDIVVVCDHSKLDDRGCNGAPDLVIEILSPSNISHDRIVKFRKYLAAGVREYWIVDPVQQIVEVHILDAGRYITTVYDASDEVPVSVLPGCTIKLQEVFSLPAGSV